MSHLRFRPSGRGPTVFRARHGFWQAQKTAKKELDQIKKEIKTEDEVNLFGTGTASGSTSQPKVKQDTVEGWEHMETFSIGTEDSEDLDSEEEGQRKAMLYQPRHV